MDFLPIKKTALQIEKAKVAAKNRDELLEAAKNGDEDAMESLTIEDLDLYSMASRRATREDIYSIVDTTFMSKRDRVRSIFDFRRDQRGYM